MIFPANHLTDISKPNLSATKSQHQKKHKQRLQITTHICKQN